MSTNENSPCGQAELLRDYAFDELPRPERQKVEQHLKQCSDCAAELDRLQLTTAALRVLPDVEVPRRIAFVSDKVFEPGWFARFWNSAARLGFASACVLAAGLSFAAYHRAPEVHTELVASAIDSKVIDSAVNKAVADAISKTHSEDMKLTQAALEAVDSKYEQKQHNLMISMAQYMDYMQKRLKTATIMTSSYVPDDGALR